MRPHRRARSLLTPSAPLLALCLAAACGRSSAPSTKAPPVDSSPPVAVTLVPAQELKVPRVLTLSGTLIGAEEAQVAAGAAGKGLAPVVERFVTAGEYVRPDSRVITLVDVDSLRVELTVPEGDVVHVRQGMPVDFQTSTGDGRTIHGRVRYIGPAVRRQTRDAVVEAVVENPGHDLRPGMFVTASLALGTQTLPA